MMEQGVKENCLSGGLVEQNTIRLESEKSHVEVLGLC